MRHRIRIIQTLRVERSLVLGIEAATACEARTLFEDGTIDLPPADDPRWYQSEWLEHEEVRLA